tara:strand:+ start:203 stop:409 length:207 start_codon:yes stop_codon:yes gene_type:complete
MKSLTATAYRATIMLTAIIFMAACGQKGPLYLPQSDNLNDTPVEEQKQGQPAVVNKTQPAASEANTNI